MINKYGKCMWEGCDTESIEGSPMYCPIHNDKNRKMRIEAFVEDTMNRWRNAKGESSQPRKFIREAIEFGIEISNFPK